MFTTQHLIVGFIAAFILGLSKTAIPGGGMLAVPLIASVVQGRLIAGAVIPMVVFADLFAVGWFGKHAYLEVLKPLIAPVLVGFGGGTAFFWIVGSGDRTLNIVLGATILLMVLIQLYRLVRRRPPVLASKPVIAVVGVAGGFTTLVSNAAGPILATYFTGLGMDKERQIGTNAWFYFSVNVAKIPVYLALGALTKGGPFFTAEVLKYNALVMPGVVFGVFLGRWILPRISQQAFQYLVMVLAGAASLKLLFGW